MRCLNGLALVAKVLLISSPGGAWAQQQPPAQSQSAPGRAPRVGGPGSPTSEGSRAVTDGGIEIPGWEGKTMLVA